MVELTNGVTMTLTLFADTSISYVVTAFPEINVLNAVKETLEPSAFNKATNVTV